MGEGEVWKREGVDVWRPGGADGGGRENVRA